MFRQLFRRRATADTASRLDTSLTGDLECSIAIEISRAHQLASAGEIPAAEAICHQVLQATPTSFDALQMLGILAAQSGRFDDAADFFRSALASRPHEPDALNNLGAALKDRGELVEAEKCFRDALMAAPGHFDACLNLGALLASTRRYSEAEDCMRRALEIRPESADACVAFGRLCLTTGRLYEAEAWLRQALDVKPDSPEAIAALANAIQGLGRSEEAEGLCHQALELQPRLADACNTLGTICRNRGELEAAEAWYRQALLADPVQASAWANLGMLARERGEHKQAEVHLRKALSIDAQNAVARYNLATLRLLQGDYQEGWQLYESRFDAFVREFTGSRGLYDVMPRNLLWQGDSLVGKRIFIWTEQGLGDSVMMMRYLPLLKARGASSIIVGCEAALSRLMEVLPSVDAAVPADIPPSTRDFDVHCPIMSLPFMFDSRLETLPAEVPYLSLPAKVVGLWRERLKAMKGARVGLVWAGSKSLREDARRSISLSQLSSLADVPSVHLVSLQKGEAAEQVKGWADVTIVDYMNECDDLLATAALVANLDLVISVDTAVAHLAGALGKPVWLLNRFGSEWRWGLEGDRTPWYPTMRIFRQAEGEDWSKVIERVAAELMVIS